MATNRADTLDPALLRPGRLDRKIEFPLPNRREKRLIFQTITGQMSLSPDVDLEDYVSRPDKLSSAEISSICQAAGLQGEKQTPLSYPRTVRELKSCHFDSRAKEQICHSASGFRGSVEADCQEK